MEFTIQYNSANRITIIKKFEFIIFQGYSSKSSAKEWLLYQSEKLIATFHLYNKWFSYSAMMHINYYANKKFELYLYYKSSFLSYTIYFKFEGITYTIYPHIHNKFSIFTENTQIGSLIRINSEKHNNSWVLKINNNLDTEVFLIISYAIFILGEKHFDKWGNDPGAYWIREVKKFNTNWLSSS